VTSNVPTSTLVPMSTLVEEIRCVVSYRNRLLRSNRFSAVPTAVTLRKKLATICALTSGRAAPVAGWMSPIPVVVAVLTDRRHRSPVAVHFGPALDFSGRAEDERSAPIRREITETVRAAVQRLSGQDYVDRYATSVKAVDPGH
jgi:hypothetical protein